MDVNDVSSVPQYMEMLQKQKRSLEQARARRGQRPAPFKTRQQLVAQFTLSVMRQQAQQSNVSRNVIHSAMVPPAYPPCVRPWSELTQTRLKYLLLETHHRGTCLILRTVTPATRWTAVMTIVEDRSGDALSLQLYQQEHESKRTMVDFLPQGSIVVVKEPYFKEMADGGYGIRVDHVSDLVCLSPWDEAIPAAWRSHETVRSAIDGKAKGNEMFKQGKYHFAIQHYTRGLRADPFVEEARLLRLNRVQAHLNVEQFDAALTDLEALSHDHDERILEKTLYRKGQALYKLGRYRECCEVYKQLLLQFPGSISSKSELNRAIARTIEQETGRYGFSQLHREACALRPPHLDHATYIGPVAIQAAGSRGLGVFTISEVKAGDLLFCEKAFARAHIDNEDTRGSQDMSILINTETNSMTAGGQASGIQIVVQKLFKNPSLVEAITSLHHGAYKPTESRIVDAMPVVDTFLVERVIALNGFGCPTTSTFETAMRENNNKEPGNATTKRQSDRLFSSSGLWPFASRINHSCCSNVRRSFIGDMMIVRATRDLPAGTELTFWYQMPAALARSEEKDRLRTWGFECDCPLCQDDQSARSTDKLHSRAQLRAKIERLGQSRPTAHVGTIKTSLDLLAQTYEQSPLEVPRIVLAECQLRLADVYASEDQPAETVECILRSFEALGFVIQGGRDLPHVPGTRLVVQRWGLLIDTLVQCWILLSDFYRVAAAPALAADANRYAKLTYKMVMGEDETFEKMTPPSGSQAIV